MGEYTYFKNKLLNYKLKDAVDEEGISQKTKTARYLNVSDYSSIDSEKLKKILRTCPTNWVAYVRINNNTNIEKISNDIYGTPDFWDLLVLLNNRCPLFEFPYDFDVIEKMTEDMVDSYEKYVYKKTLPAEIKERLRVQYADKMAKRNEELRVIRYIKPEYVYEFISQCKRLGVL